MLEAVALVGANQAGGGVRHEDTEETPLYSCPHPSPRLPYYFKVVLFPLCSFQSIERICALN